MTKERLLTVARFLDGSWSTGGRPDSPEYAQAEVFQVWATTDAEAKRKAQSERRKKLRQSQSGPRSSKKKTYFDKTKCPLCKGSIVIVRRIPSAGKEVSTWLQCCKKQKMLIAGPVPQS